MLVELAAATTVFGIYKYLFLSQQRKIKNQLQELFKEKSLKNKKGYFPKILSIELKNYGAIVLLDIKSVCSFQDIEKHKDYIKTLFGALSVDLIYKNEFVEIQLFLNELQDLKSVSYTHLTLPTNVNV